MWSFLKPEPHKPLLPKEKIDEDGTKTYKVTLVDAAGTENPVLFNEKGEVQK